MDQVQVQFSWTMFDVMGVKNVWMNVPLKAGVSLIVHITMMQVLSAKVS